MNSRGITLSNLLEIILAVICIFLLMYAAFLVYDRVVKDEETTSAKSAMNMLNAKSEALETGQSGTFLFRGVNSEEMDNNGDPVWKIVGWSRGELGRPDRCYFESCVCVCKIPVVEGVSKNGFDRYCSELGVCRDFEESSVVVKGSSARTSTVRDTSSFVGAGVAIGTRTVTSVESVPYISLPQNFVVLKISDDGDSLVIEQTR